jgi:uncharacterized membrane protein YbhN (UPF0104 family)
LHIFEDVAAPGRFGHRLNPVTVFVAYGIANLLGTLPISPAGLGVIDSSRPWWVSGATRAVAVLAVVSWRLFEFWVPIPVGGLSYLSLRVEPWRRSRSARAIRY